MAKWHDYEEVNGDDGSLYNIYTISFNNIKVPDKTVEVGRHFHRILKLEERIVELQNHFKNFVKLPDQVLTLGRRSLTSHSEFKWKLKEGTKWVVIGSKDPRLKSYLESLLDVVAETEIRSHLFEVDLINANLKIEWARYLAYCDLVSWPKNEIIFPKQMPAILERRANGRLRQ